MPLIDGAVSFQRNPVGNPASILDPPPAAGSRITVLDQFSTENRFYGGQVGGRFQWLYNRFTVDLTGKLALGVTHQESSIAGVSTLDNPATVTQGGLLALKSNIGELSRDQFTVVPELGINFQYDVTPRIRTRIGYSGLYSVRGRPSRQPDRPQYQSQADPHGPGLHGPHQRRHGADSTRPRLAQQRLLGARPECRNRVPLLTM